MLTVTADLGVVDRAHRVVVSCACGTTGKTARFKSLKNGEARSCGCQMNGDAHRAASTARLLAWNKAQPQDHSRRPSLALYSHPFLGLLDISQQSPIPNTPMLTGWLIR